MNYDEFIFLYDCFKSEEKAILSYLMEKYIRRQAIKRLLDIIKHDEEAEFPTEREWMNIVLIRYSSLLQREQSVFAELVKELLHCVTYGQEMPFVPPKGSLFSSGIPQEEIEDDFHSSEKEIQRMRMKAIEELVILNIAKTENDLVIAVLNEDRLNKLENSFMILEIMEGQVYKEITEGKDHPKRNVDYDPLTGVLDEIINGKAHQMTAMQINGQTKRFMDYVWEHQKQKLAKRKIAKDLGIHPKDLKNPTYVDDMGFNEGDRKGRYFLPMRQGFVWFQKEYDYSATAEK